jgi:hypothetical protein
MAACLYDNKLAKFKVDERRRGLPVLMVGLTPVSSVVRKSGHLRFCNAAEKPLTYPQQLLAWRLDRRSSGEPCPARTIEEMRELHAKRFIQLAQTVKPEKYPLTEDDYEMLSRLMLTFFYKPLAQAITGSQVNPMPDDYVIRFRTRQLPELLGYRDSEAYEAETRRLLYEAFKR